MRTFLLVVVDVFIFVSGNAVRPSMTDSFMITYEDAPNGGLSQTINVGTDPYNWYGVVDPAAPPDFARNIIVGTTGQTLATLAANADGTGLIKPYTATHYIYAINNNAVHSTTYSWYIYGIRQQSDVPTYNVAKANGQIKLEFTGPGFVTLLNAAAPYYFTLTNFDIGKIAQLQVYTTGYPSVVDKYKVIETTTKEQAAAAVVNIVGPIATIYFDHTNGKTSATFDARVGSDNTNIEFTAGGMMTAMSPGWAAEGESFASMAALNRKWVFTASDEVSSDIQIDLNPATCSDSLTIDVSGTMYYFGAKVVDKEHVDRTFSINVTSSLASPESQFLTTIYTSRKDGGTTLASRTTTNPPTVSCPPGYNALLGGCVNFVSEVQSFDVAELLCREDGGHLVSIHSPQENDALGSFAAQYGFPVFFTGLQSFAGFRSWSDGSPYDYDNFGTGFPNDSDGICVQFSLWNSEWESVACENKLPFVCATTRLPEQ